MGYHDVAFLSSQTSFSSAFLEDCGRFEGLRTTIYLRTVVGVKHGHSTCKILFLHRASFYVNFN